MEAALYGPGGYYAERPSLGGAGADYFTAPELHPAFGALLGRQVAQVWEALGRPSRFDVVEHGPGSGALCRDLRLWAAHDAPDFAAAARYTLVERSTPLQETQRATLAGAGLLDGRVGWEAPAPGGKGRYLGVILANELLDALPVHLVAVREGRLLERYVAPDETGPGLTFVEAAPSTRALAAYFEALGLLPGEGCRAEVNLGAVAWAEQAAASLERGALLTLDYGYPAPELYAPHRRHGTLLTYRGHALGSDPLVRIGEQDITSHVDFTSIARAGERGGLETLGLVDQATFLHNLGLRQYLRLLEQAGQPAQDYDANRRALLELASRDGLGAIKVLIQTRGLPGFQPTGLGPSKGPPYPPKIGEVGGAPPRAGQANSTGDPWLPLLHPGQMRLPGPLEAEGFADLESQWHDFWTGEEEE
ncbi:MAG: SAM-dependent methyltransferase [Chloroflexi bacterium]|nr:SAM-dependent methyltransferase [Chloroflexota bacterium]